MGGEQAASVLLQVKVRSLQKKGINMTPEEQDAFIKPTLEKYDQESSAYFSTANLWDDGIIDPIHTRAALGLGIATSLNSPIPETKYGIFRM